MPHRKTKRSDGRHAATMRYEDPLTGAKRRAYFYGRTQAEANAKARAARDRLTAGSPVRDDSQTLGDWITKWCATFLRASDRARATKVLYEGLMRRHVVPRIGSIPLDRLKPVDITRLLLAMESAGAAVPWDAPVREFSPDGSNGTPRLRAAVICGVPGRRSPSGFLLVLGAGAGPG